MQFKGKRIIVSSVCESDLESLLSYEIKNRELFEPFCITRNPDFYTVDYQINNINRIIKHQNDDIEFVFLIRLMGSNTVIGKINLDSIIKYKYISSASIGCTLDNDYQKKGYMTEAFNLVLDFCFNTLNLHRISAQIQNHNENSKKLTNRLGFKFEGVNRELAFINDKWVDHNLYSLLSHEFNN